jgi:sec-independent protein translocase protein TatA
MPSTLGAPEILVILVVALIVLGPARLPEAGRQVGKALNEIRKWTQDMKSEVADAFQPEPPRAPMPPEPMPQETTLPETSLPETSVPETGVPETGLPETRPPAPAATSVPSATTETPPGGVTATPPPALSDAPTAPIEEALVRPPPAPHAADATVPDLPLPSSGATTVGSEAAPAAETDAPPTPSAEAPVATSNGATGVSDAQAGVNERTGTLPSSTEAPTPER